MVVSRLLKIVIYFFAKWWNELIQNLLIRELIHYLKIVLRIKLN